MSGSSLASFGTEWDPAKLQPPAGETNDLTHDVKRRMLDLAGAKKRGAISCRSRPAFHSSGRNTAIRLLPVSASSCPAS